MTSLLVGIILAFIPLLLIGIILLRRKLPVFAFYLAMSILAIGYLLTTGAIEDIGRGALLIASEPLKD